MGCGKGVIPPPERAEYLTVRELMDQYNFSEAEAEAFAEEEPEVKRMYAEKMKELQNMTQNARGKWLHEFRRGIRKVDDDELHLPKGESVTPLAWMYLPDVTNPVAAFPHKMEPYLSGPDAMLKSEEGQKYKVKLLEEAGAASVSVF